MNLNEELRTSFDLRALRPQGLRWKIEGREGSGGQVLNALEYAVCRVFGTRLSVRAAVTDLEAQWSEPRVLRTVRRLRQLGLLVPATHPGEAAGQLFMAAQTQRLRFGQLDSRRLADLDPNTLNHALDTDCGRCTISCCRYHIDLTDEDLDDVLAAAPAAGLDPATLLQPQRTAKGRFRLTRTSAGDCVALEAGQRCAIHRVVGLSRKPLVCQFYPASIVATPNEVRVASRLGCPHPVPTEAPEDVAAFRTTVTRIASSQPEIVVCVPPERIVLAEGTVVDWDQWAAWEHTLAPMISGASSAVEALEESVACLMADWEVVERRLDPGALASMIGGLASLFAEDGLAIEEGVLTDLACGEGAPPSRRCPSAIVTRVFHGLAPMRYPSVLGGLGVIRLFIAASERDPRSADGLEDSAARWFRWLDSDRINDALARASLTFLEGLATHPLEGGE